MRRNAKSTKSITTNNKEVKKVHKFTNLGSPVTTDKDTEKDAKNRLNKTNQY